MDKLNIGETILKLRKEKNITQEELGNLVGVSAGAVSKWETGNSTPDISLLAPIARALNTSLDVLLSFKQELTEAEVNDIKKKLTDIFLHEGYEAGEEKCMEYLNEYPNCIYLNLSAAGLIEMYSEMSEGLTEDIINERLKKSLNLFKKVAESRDTKYAPIALFGIASIQMMLKNYDESEKALKELPKVSVNPMDLYPVLMLRQGRKKDAIELCSRMLMKNVNDSFYDLITLSHISKSEKDYDKAQFYLNAAYNIQSEFKIGIGAASFNYAMLYIEMDRKQDAAKWFKTYVEEILSFGYDYSSNPYFKNIVLEVNQDGQKAIRKKSFESLIIEDDLKVLAGIPDYDSAIEKLKAAVCGM